MDASKAVKYIAVVVLALSQARVLVLIQTNRTAVTADCTKFDIHKLQNVHALFI